MIAKKRFAMFDTETTGLTKHPQAPLSEQPRIIEFGGIITDGFEILDELEFICNPGQAIDEVITKITGLTNADLEDKKPFGFFIDQLKDFFYGSDVVLAHNASFDKCLLTYDLARNDLLLSDINFPSRVVCTVEETNPLYGFDRKLADLYNERVGDYVQTHRALSDVKQLHQICINMGVYKALGAKS